jgi:uncharacterized protein YfaS (alpha-2-macroglobulin family)
MHNLLTDKDGLALLNRTNQYSQLHVLVKSGDDRLAWSGMSYWTQYNPSDIKSGLLAYCITDRPVYRPEQTVRFKVWLRQMNNGILQNQPNQGAHIEIYDPRGNKIYNVSKQSDQYGGLDGDFTLGAEPSLGVYRIQISGQSYIGGQNFRVEEYKKPEFEVTVEPGKSLTKLGEVITAVIKANYYFGGAVTDAKDKKIKRNQDVVVTVTGTNLVGEFILKKGNTEIKAGIVKVKADANNFSNLTEAKATFKTNITADTGYKLIIKNAGGISDDKQGVTDGFEVVD